MLPTLTEPRLLTLVDREEALLRIKANPNDPILFETFFCADCVCFVVQGGITSEREVYHSKHRLAWLPAVEEPAPGQSFKPIGEWLNLAPLSPKRQEWLAEIAKKTTPLSWAWVLTSEEQTDWFDYLENYLAELADSWLAALNGSESRWLKSEQVWQTDCPPGTAFGWQV